MTAPGLDDRTIAPPYLKLKERNNYDFVSLCMNSLIIYSNIIKIGPIKIITYIFDEPFLASTKTPNTHKVCVVT